MNQKPKYRRPDSTDASGFALPLILMILFLVGLIQLRLTARVRELASATTIRIESTRALTEARNKAIEAVYLNKPGTAVLIKRASTTPIRIESLTAEAQIEDAIKRYEILTLSSPSNSPRIFPDWQTLRAIGPVELCRHLADPQLTSSVSCLVDHIEQQKIFEGNLIARNSLVLSLNVQPSVGVFAVGDISLESLEISSNRPFQLELAAIGDIKIKKLFLNARTIKSLIGSTILLHSSRGKIDVGLLEGISACLSDSPSAAVQLGLQFAAPSTVGSNLINSSGRGGCSVQPAPERFKASRTVGSGPA